MKTFGGIRINFEQLRRANIRRCDLSFHPVEDWSPSEWSNAVAGEAGEVSNLTKKLKRGDKITFDKGQEIPLNAATIGAEIADVIIYADLLAARLGLDLGEIVRAKFNATSERIGSAVNL